MCLKYSESKKNIMCSMTDNRKEYTNDEFDNSVDKKVARDSLQCH